MAKGLYTKYLSEPTIYSPRKTYGGTAPNQIDINSIPRFTRPPSRVPIYIPPPDPNYVLESYYSYGFSLADAPDYDYTPIPLLLNPLSGYVLENYVSREF